MKRTVPGARAAVAVICALLCTDVSASDKRGSYVIYAAGNMSCGKWTEIRKSPYDSGIAQWLAGYITAFNLYSFWEEDAGSGTDINGLAAWVDNYCRENPLDSLARASAALVTELVAKRAKDNDKSAN